MLQTGPHIHGNGTQLDLHRQMQRPLGDDDGYVDDEVQTAIAGFLGLLDVVHLPQHLEGFGPGQQAAEIVDVIQIVADDPDTGYVLYVGIDIVDGDVVAPAAQLIADALQRLDAVLDVVNGRMVVQTGELLVQDLHLGHGHLQGTAVQVIHPYHALSQFPLLRRSAGGNGDILETDAAALFDHHGTEASL